ncbi:MAG: biotin/lipoyl-binding protein [Dysgonamonadaceae bacterium]|jgi:biotin carboxyl carrier protein|nr:biotin/lipoyl-binding protein [Dysgonamonadaceae bacterium]
MKNFKYTINGTVYNVVVNSIDDAIANIEVNGAPYKVEMEKQEKKQQAVVNPTRPATVPVTPIARPVAVAASGPKALRSPLPGTIIEVSCKVGDSVKKGQKLMVLEAMKMENSINSDKDGVVKEIKVNQGDAVLEGNDLIVIE